MKKLTAKQIIYLAVISGLLSGCMSGGNKLFWGLDEGKQEKSKSEAVQAASRPALDIPPELRGEVAVPKANAIARTSVLPERYKKIVAGKKVGLDARVYKQPAGQVFSSVIDAMTAMNLPVESVDSASGTITTDWVKTDVNNPNLLSGISFLGDGIMARRYRFVVRVLRQELAEESQPQTMTRLEVRTLGQVFQTKHWVNRSLKRNYANDLFSSVEERLSH